MSPTAKSVRSQKSDVFKQTVRFRRELGQHILKNPLILEAMIDRAGIHESDTVLEIGPGTGNLTVKLLERVKKVVAYEVDPRLIAELHKRIGSGPSASFRTKLEIVLGDVIKSKLPERFDVCVANVPYKISSPLVFKLLGHSPSPRCFVLMFQKEFVDRLVAKPGDKDYCRLSVNVDLLARVDHLFRVKRSNFKPPPRVDSAIVRIEPRNPRPPVDLDQFDAFLRMCFNRKNKKIKSQLTGKLKAVNSLLKIHRLLFPAHRFATLSDQEALNEFKQLLINVLDQSGHIESRARHLSTDDFLYLLAEFNEKGVYFA